MSRPSPARSPVRSHPRPDGQVQGRSLGSYSMSTPHLVKAFYERIWNDGDLQAVTELLATRFVFRGSLGNETRCQEDFKEYVRLVRESLSDYCCEIIDCVSEGDRAFARMRFSGLHTGMFRGFAPTNRTVCWEGAALFRFEGGVIAELWVLGDLSGLDRALRDNAKPNQATGETVCK